MTRIFHSEFVVPESVVDTNNHVNNVAYVQWMQDVAIAHSTQVGGTQATQAVGATWVARSHHILYLRPAFAGETIRLSTWIASAQRARSRRKYQFFRVDDETVIATGETEWVFVDAQTGRPKSIPEQVASCYEVVADDPMAASPSTPIS